jgi:predicted enzyme related to lactoylglutathione lyase
VILILSASSLPNKKTKTMKVKLLSVLVDDQDKALKFYTEKLGFVKKTEVPMGEYRWLTVVSKEEQDGVEVLLEPMAFAPAKVYQKALFDAGIPLVAFLVEDVEKEVARLSVLNVQFSMMPTQMGPVKIAVLNDTCGNNIQLFQVL